MSEHEDEEVDWEELAEEIKMNHRPHAGHFSWETDKTLAESGVLQEFQNSLAEQGKLFFHTPMHRGEANDPPDCEAFDAHGKRVGIEITELVDPKSAAAARAGVYYEWKDWKGTLIPEIQRILTNKGSPSDLKDPPYSEYIVVIFSDEPWMEHDSVELQLQSHRFIKPELITRAFFLLSYSPYVNGYPCYEIQFQN